MGCSTRVHTRLMGLWPAARCATPCWMIEQRFSSVCRTLHGATRFSTGVGVVWWGDEVKNCCDTRGAALLCGGEATARRARAVCASFHASHGLITVSHAHICHTAWHEAV